MNNMIVLPMAIPLLFGILLVFLQPYIRFQRWGTVFMLVINSAVSIYILLTIQTKGILRLDFGEWLPPFGILFVADSFSMLLVVTTSIVSTFAVLYAFATIGHEREQLYFYAFVSFLIAGVNGSFLTGDIFNLFVMFEVMLLASYALITLGGKKFQLKESIVYIAINVVSSSLFLIAIAFLYGTIGTLNMAHISERITEVGQTPLLTIISLLFLLVFSIKSGLMLYQWLPGSYSVPPTAIAALFGALLTKVGIYALFRFFTLMFYHQPGITHKVIGFMALITLIGGSIGAMAYINIRKIISYNVIISVGFILIGLVVASTVGYEGAIYYLIHDMFAKALLILLGGTMIYLTKTELYDEMSGLIRNYPFLGWMFFLTVLALVGIPPLSGFIGKLLIAQGAVQAGEYVLLIVGFLSSLIVLYSLMRIFMNCFWGETILSEDDVKPLRKIVLLPCLALTIIVIALGIYPESIAPIVQDAAKTLANPDLYIKAILNN